MKASKIILSALLAVGVAFGAKAETVEVDTTVTVFNPHWYVLGQVGGQETLGEGSFGKLASFNAQIGVGYNFNPVFGARLVLNSWTSRGTITVDNKKSDWKWKYIAPTVDLTVNLVNLLGGYDPARKVDAGIFAGVGANIAYDNDEANAVNKALKASTYPSLSADVAPNPLENIWDGTKARFVGQFGAYVDYAVSQRVKIGLELQANVLPDGYNSKKAGNADWYFNALVGVKYCFGATTKTANRKVYRQVEYRDRIIEKPVEVIREVVKEVPAPYTNAPALRRDIFFKISKTNIAKSELPKLDEIIAYLNQYPESKVTITGYADKGTGTLKLNMRLAYQRAQVVVEALKAKGIAADRISAASMGEEAFQPYSTPETNRVAICVAE